MTDDEIRWVAEAAMRYDALVFVIVGRYGSQPVLFPRFLYGRPSTLHQE